MDSWDTFLFFSNLKQQLESHGCPSSSSYFTCGQIGPEATLKMSTIIALFICAQYTCFNTSFDVPTLSTWPRVIASPLGGSLICSQQKQLNEKLLRYSHAQCSCRGTLHWCYKAIMLHFLIRYNKHWIMHLRGRDKLG